jgi:hypothetical protein
VVNPKCNEVFIVGIVVEEKVQQGLEVELVLALRNQYS